jgi:6-pyruvoyltetrahydropterin/6-carboxytetrahydropterin synthase
MPFEITHTRTFSASHRLRLYDGTLEPLHGHNWRVRVAVSAPGLDEIGVVMDFHELARLVDMILGPMDSRHLNDLEPFATGSAADNPSAENVALHVGRSLQSMLAERVRLVSVRVWETEENSAVYRP